MQVSYVNPIIVLLLCSAPCRCGLLTFHGMLLPTLRIFFPVILSIKILLLSNLKLGMRVGFPPSILTLYAFFSLLNSCLPMQLIECTLLLRHVLYASC